MGMTTMSEALLKGITRGLADTNIGPKHRLNLRDMRKSVLKAERVDLPKDNDVSDVLDALLS